MLSLGIAEGQQIPLVHEVHADDQYLLNTIDGDWFEILHHFPWQDYRHHAAAYYDALYAFNRDERDAANALWINGNVLVADGYPDTNRLIKNAGYRTIPLDISEFHKVDVTAQRLPFTWVGEAEDPPGVAVKPLLVGEDPEASACLYVYSHEAGTDAAIIHSFSVPSAGEYYLWSRAMALARRSVSAEQVYGAWQNTPG